MKNLPIGLQTFREMIEEDYLYIDKTREIHRLLSTGGKYYFISRPRRFGKSLLVSTLKEIFSGSKELFKDLWIHDKIDWKSYPVIHIDFTDLNYRTPERLEETLNRLMDDIAKEHGVALDSERYLNERFSQLIKELSIKGKVAILIDEYDKPIIDNIDDPETARGNRKVLKEFYGVLKSADRFIKFVLITGVSRFARVSVFSDLNNLDDITLDSGYSTLMGYTEDELRTFFKGRIEELGKEWGGGDQLINGIRDWYNGYSWDGTHFVYNPFSVLNFFQKKKVGGYWFATGTPTFLVKLLREKGWDARQYEEIPVGEYIFETYDIENLETISLLFQTGYLTVKSRTNPSPSSGKAVEYILTYPNKEVRDYLIEDIK